MATLREAFEYPFSLLDPVASDHVDPPAVAVFETLLERGPGGQPMPGLCDRWEVGDDSLVWRLWLRDGARFHSGDPCDAATVARALDACRWGDGWSRQLWYWDPVDEVRAVGGDTLEFRLRHPWARLPTLLWGTHTAIANPDRRWRPGEPFAPGAVDGTGPFRITSADDARVAGERAWSPLAGGPRAPGLVDAVVWSAVPDDADRRSLLDGPGADVVRGARAEWFADGAPPGWRHVEHAEASQYYLAFDCEDPRGFGSTAVRRAVEAFIDRERLVAEAFGGVGDARRSPVPAADSLADPFDDAAQSPLARAEAERVLADHGWPRGPDGTRVVDGVPLVVDCVAQDTPEGLAVAAAVRRQLAEAGIVLELRPVRVFADFYAACAARPAAFVSKWLWPDAIEAVMGFSETSCIADSGGNWQHASCPELDAAFDRYRRAATDAEVRDRAADVQAVFMRELPYLPLCAPRVGYAVRSGVVGYEPTAHTLYPHYRDLSVSAAGREAG